MSKPTFTNIFFQEAKTTEALEELLQLRYRVYRIHHPLLIPDNSFGLDIDCYDVRARHFGVYGQNELGLTKPIGYLRVIVDERPPLADLVEQVAIPYGSKMLKIVQAEPTVPFPTMIYFPEGKQAIDNMYAQIKADNEGTAYFFRISAEETTLENIFGAAYRQYRLRTWRLVPFVW
jgi:hypothetical protein